MLPLAIFVGIGSAKASTLRAELLTTENKSRLAATRAHLVIIMVFRLLEVIVSSLFPAARAAIEFY
jgi:hypothetical protein